MTALRSIHIIDGKATFAAELMVLLVRRNGHSITGDVSDGSATVTGTRADNGDTMTSTWTTAMADRAGLLNKQNWKKYPEAMLWARAVSQLCRMLFADCFAGNTYTPEELDADVTEEPLPVEDDGKFPPPDSAELEPVAVISAAQLRRLRTIQTTRGIHELQFKALVAEICGVASSKDIPRVRYDAIVAAVEAAQVEAPAAAPAGAKESGAAGTRAPRSDGPVAPELSEEEFAAAEAASSYVVTIEPADAWVNGLTLAQVHAEDRGVAFFKWALGLTAGRGKNQDADLEAACRAYARAHLPAVHDEAAVTA